LYETKNSEFCLKVRKKAQAKAKAKAQEARGKCWNTKIKNKKRKKGGKRQGNKC